jgi:hypothetical protein
MATVPIPQIDYNGLTLSFVLPPINKPGQEERHATRHDVFTISGKRQSSIERIDRVMIVEMAYVAMGVDLAAWADFIDYAMQGGSFTYYPDSTNLSIYETVELEDTDWTPKFAFRSYSKFTLKLRRLVGSPVIP